MESAKVGKRGAIVVPAKLRRRFGIEEGTVVIAEEREDGILIRPAVVVPIEKYTPERKAEFLLSNATNAADYRKARTEVQKLGIDPDSVPPSTVLKWPACSSMLMFYFRRHTGPLQDFLSSGNLERLSCVALAMRWKKRELILIMKFNEPG